MPYETLDVKLDPYNTRECYGRTDPLSTDPDLKAVSGVSDFVVNPEVRYRNFLSGPPLPAQLHSIIDLRPVVLFGDGWRRSVVVSTLTLINVANRHWARLLLGWVTACGQVNHFGM